MRFAALRFGLRPRAPWSLDHRATAGMLIMLGLLLVAGIAAQLTMRRAGATAHLVAHTHRVVRSIDGLRAALLDAEADQRGYQLSGDRAYLEALRDALPQARAAAEDLRRLTEDNPEQQERLDALEPLLQRRLALLREAADSDHVHPATDQPAPGDAGKQVLDELRTLLTALRDAELTLLAERTARSEAAGWWLGLTTALASLLALAAAIGAVLLINRGAERQRAAEAALRRREEADHAREQAALRQSHGELALALVQSEEARQVADELARTVFRASPLAFVALDPEGHVRLWNPAAARAFGWTEPEVLGQPYPLVLPGKQAEFRDLFDRALGGATLLGVETQRRGKDGKPVEVSVSAAPLRGAGGDVTGVLAVLADVGERKALEAEVRRAQKLEAVGRLAGGIAHDFNNLLTVINGCCDLLMLRLPPDDPGRELLDAVHGAGERAATLTRQLLAFGRRQTLQPHVLNLNAVVTDLVKLLGRLIGEDMTLELALDAAPAPVCGDRGQLEQVVMNLALNARDAMPRGGRLTIETHRVDLDDSYAAAHCEVRPGPYILLVVSDNGVGMDEETRAHLFEPFFTTKGPGKGTGLGLATVYAVVKQAGGDIEFASAPGAGTTVRVYLPRAEEPAAPPPACSQRPGSVGGAETVLLVEDEPRVRKLVREVLRHRGYTVLEAGDGVEALRVAAGHPGPIHLLVTDVVMPRLSGRALAEHLAALRPALKVLYLSGYTGDAVLRHGVEEGLAFLQKPFTPDALAARVRAVLAAR